jgi:DNA processing protein
MSSAPMTRDPPDQLYIDGRRVEIGSRTVAVVGTRRPTAAGIEAVEQITRGLVEAGFTIVSGMALGIDTLAHRAALSCGGYTIAVLGSGLDVPYPLRNAGLMKRIASEGSVVTEYPEGSKPHAFHFPQRNRIVVGLSRGVVVVEGGMKSGALITARIGIDANRFVWAVPGSTRNPMAVGPNELIRTGQAALVTSFKHVCDDVAPGLVWEEGPGARPLSVEALTEEEKTILLALDDVPISSDRLGRATDLPQGRVALALSRLEVRGFVNRRAGGYEISGGGGRIRDAIS